LDQAGQALLQLLALGATQSELANQLLVPGGLVRLALDVAQDGLIVKHEPSMR